MSDIKERAAPTTEFMPLSYLKSELHDMHLHDSQNIRKGSHL